jgi:uncharacterized protein (TIGR03084 family)
MSTPIDDVLDDLVAEYDRLEAILESLTDDQWRSESDAKGWTVTDVMIHLAQTEEAVVGTTTRPNEPNRLDRGGVTLDEWVDRQVASERDEPAVVFARWKAARRASVDALRSADPDARYSWAHTPLKPRTLATTRLAEHWAHALDVTVPFDIALPDTNRLRHIAWLGHSTLPYGFELQGQEAQPVYCELTEPDGASVWRFGPPDAESKVTGAAGAFCRVGAQRLSPDASGLVTSGPHAEAALRVLRNYAG